MQLTTFAIAALSIGSALAKGSSSSSSNNTAASSGSSASSSSSSSMITMHVVSVSSANGSLTYSPDNIVAAKGDMVQFQFFPANHTVTQSSFDAPCAPISSSSSNTTGIFSGFMPVTAADTMIPTYTVMINATTPMWLYCSQASHCQKGMVMVINEDTTANATRSLANFKTGAAAAKENLAPSSASDGTAGSTASTSSGTTSSGTESGSSSGTSGTSTSSATSTVATGANAGSALRPSEMLGLAGLFAVGAGLLL